jgi:hypothetical protein
VSNQKRVVSSDTESEQKMFYIIDSEVKGANAPIDRPFTTREDAMEWIDNFFTSLGYPKDWYVPKIDNVFKIEYIKQKHYTMYL